jgi:microcin C transport system substrate-binding protein
LRKNKMRFFFKSCQSRLFKKGLFWVFWAFCSFFVFPSYAKQDESISHGLALYDDLKYPENFPYFQYVNPKAPKGGSLKMASFSGFDTFNPFSIYGIAPAGIGLLFDSLMTASQDEPFSVYGLLAEKVKMPADKSWVEFYLNPKAKFHDGSPVLPEDVLFTFDTLKKKGPPLYRYYYEDVEKTEKTGPLSVRFTFKKGVFNRELPLIIGQMPVLSEKNWKDIPWETTSMEIPVGSGPYRIESYEAGRKIVYKRDESYWGKDLPVNKGFYNFDRILYETYRDSSVAVEALKAGAYDLRVENEAKKWVGAYSPDVLKKTGLVKKEFSHSLPSGMQGFVFNLRSALFQDIRVRKALGYAFDFKWTNRALFSGLYKRTTSYFDNSPMAGNGPLTAEVEKRLSPFKEELPPEIFEKAYENPEPVPSLRDGLTKALSLLQEAGWRVQNNLLVNEKGEPFVFEFLLESSSSSTWERVVLPFIQNLKRLGIRASVRLVDPTQYKTKLDNFDFDVVVNVWGQSLSPGNEQRHFWGSESAMISGSSNLGGIQNKVVDALIEQLISSETRQELVTATQALDRVLLFHYYVIPHWYTPVNRLVYKDKFGMPENVPMQGVQLMSWWNKTAEKASAQKEKEQ